MIHCKGSAFEIGFSHGNAAKEKVHHSMQTYERMFYEYGGFSWKKAQETALSHVKAIHAYNAAYLDEMEGLAKGAGVAFEDILTLNARSEIALVNAPDGCTSFALTKPVSERTWLAQNWDWRGEQLESLIHLKIEQNDLPSFQMVTEAGIIGKIGCNEAGIGVCLNALITDAWASKVPIHLGLRAVLESSTMEEAVSRVDNNQMASAAHFLIASGTGEMVSAEVSPVHTAIKKADSGVLSHTNHICSEALREKVKENALPNSYVRYDTINQLLEQLRHKRTDLKEEDLFALLSNHDHAPNAICRHPIPGSIGRERSETVFAIVMNLTDVKLSWVKGRPCEAEAVIRT